MPNKPINAPPLTHERLLEVMHYDPDTGICTWRISGKKRTIGAVAGCLKHTPSGDYRVICIDWILYRAARLIWFYQTGEWPPDGLEVDHKDCVGTNDKWSNLRLATSSQSKQNRRYGRKKKELPKGVSFHIRRRKYQAHLGQMYLGIFDTPEEAHAAHVEAGKKHFGEFFRAGDD